MIEMSEVQAALSRLNAAIRGANGNALSVPVLVSDVTMLLNFSKSQHDQIRFHVIPRPIEEYHEDMGPVTWWKFPIDEPAWIGTPNDSDWPGYHTHFTPHPPLAIEPRVKS